MGWLCDAVISQQNGFENERFLKESARRQALSADKVKDMHELSINVILTQQHAGITDRCTARKHELRCR